LAVMPIEGRYIPAEGPQDSDFEHGKLSTMTPGAFLNTWTTPDAAGIYGGYLTSAVAAPGLARIDSPKPSSAVEVNLLNIFYAVEWVVFAGFAIFLWYRLVRDTWEREQEEAAEAAGSAGNAADAQPAHLN
jgi:surfeit locus 1 family protein